MSLRKVANVVGFLQIFVSLSMFLTALVAVSYGGSDWSGFVIAGVITLVIGWSVYIATRFEGDLTTREGFAIVTMAWTATAIFGALPYLLTGVLESPVAPLSKRCRASRRPARPSSPTSSPCPTGCSSSEL